MSQCCNIFSHLITSGFSKKKKSTNQIHDQTAFHLSHLFTTFILACFDFLEKHSGGMKKERSKMKMVSLCNRKFTSFFAGLEEFLGVRGGGFDGTQKKICVLYFKQIRFTQKISNVTLTIEIYLFICMPFTLTSVEWISFNFHSSASPKWICLFCTWNDCWFNFPLAKYLRENRS